MTSRPTTAKLALPVVFFIALGLFCLLFKIGWQLSGADNIRRPSFAGSWYFGNREHLRSELKGFAEQVERDGLVSPHAAQLIENNQQPGRHLIAVLSPHAALRYSGLAAQHSYAALRGQKVERIFLLGPLHFKNAHGAFLPQARIFATPLGDLNIDANAIADLARKPYFQTNASMHKFEHSLEMQLPFIKENFSQCSLVPILIGMNSSPEEMQSLAAAIRANLQTNDLVVISSDFTHWGKFYHYVPFEENVEANIQDLDRRAFKAIKQIDAEALLKFKKETRDTICGFNAIYILLKILPTDTQCTLFDYYTSRQPAGQEEVLEKDRSISYLAAGFYARGW